MSDQRTLFIGMDAGGTKTRLAYRFFDDLAPQYFVGPGTNINRDGLDKSIRTCAQVIKDGCNKDLVNNHLVLCAGISGAGRPHDRAQITSRLEEEFKSSTNTNITILPDTDIAYHAAHDEESGVLIIMGTGSIILAKTRDGQFVRAGGWGYLMGDEAGGFRLAQAGLEAVANAYDGGPFTLLQQRLQEMFGLDSGDALIEFVYREDTIIQQLAPVVVEAAEADDEIAIQIIENQVTRLADRLFWLFEQHPDIKKQISLVGGLSDNPFYKTRLISCIHAIFPDASFSHPLNDPADAALAIAIKGH